MPSFLDLWTERSASDLKAQLVALCQANALPVTAWLLGRPSERWLDITPRLIYAVLYGAVRPAARAFFLDFLTDPGDDGDKSADQTPRPGFLSAMGEGWYGTTRRGQTYATTTLTLTNTSGSGSSIAFSAFDLTFTTTDAGDHPTFRNEGGSGILGPGGTVTLSVRAEQIGKAGTVSTGSLVLVTHSFDGTGTLAVTASVAAVGEEREDADLYRARCRRAAAKLSPGGPSAAYEYAANTANDGTPLQRHDGSGPVAIVKSYVTPASPSGLVDAYFANDTGACDTVDLDSADANISGVPLGVITTPIGVVPDGVTYTGHAAINTTIAITATAKIKSRKGTVDAALKAAAELAIPLAWDAYFAALDIGGRDQTSGAGVVPTSDLLGVVYATRLAGESAAAGLHAVAVTAPSGSTTAVALGHVAIRGVTSITVTVVP